MPHPIVRGSPYISQEECRGISSDLPTFSPGLPTKLPGQACPEAFLETGFRRPSTSGQVPSLQVGFDKSLKAPHSPPGLLSKWVVPIQC